MRSESPLSTPSVVRIGDRYEVVRRLGRGGMATVYEVVDTNNSEHIALKQLTLAAMQSSPRVKTFFQREFHTLSQLTHPCIIGVRDYGVDPLGPFYTMELLDGRDLRALAPLQWREACTLMRDVASSLGVLHARRLLHRDIHYRNVRCTSDGHAKLLDFGTLTTFGAATDVAGVPPFIPPEALRGQPLDARCDLYSLGCLMYWVLTAKHAFDARELADLESLWARGTPRVSEWAPDVPPALEMLLCSMMAMDPMARPSSAAEVIQRLNAVTGLAVTEADEVGRSYLQNPRLVARERELEQIRRVVASQLRHVSSAPPGRIDRGTADFSVKAKGRGADGVRSTGSRATGEFGARERSRGEPQLLVLEGPARSGRSRLLLEFVLEAKLAGALVLMASASKVRAETHGVADRLIDQLRDVQPDRFDRLSDADQKLFFGWQSSGLPGASGSRARGGRMSDEDLLRKQALLKSVLLEAATTSGLVLAIDDMEACDVASAALLNAIVDAAPGKRILIGVALRTDAEPIAKDAVGRLRARGGRVPLLPLEEADVEALIRSLFGPAQHLRPLASWAWKTSAGWPLACMELVQHLVDAGLIRYERGGWILPNDPDSHGLPSTLRSVLEALVRSLSPSARALAELLAMFSAPVPLERCVEVFGRGEAEAFNALGEATARNIVSADGSRYGLAHRDLRDVLLADMPADERRALHLRIGRWMSGHRRFVIDAAWHLMEGGVEFEGAHLLLAEAHRSVQSLAGRALRVGDRGTSVLARARDIYALPTASSSDRLTMEMAIVVHATYLESGDLRRGADLVAQLERDAGLAGFAERDPTIEPLVWLERSTKAAIERYAALPEQARGFAPADALLHLPMCAINLSRSFGQSGDVEGLDGLVRAVEPYRYFQSPLSLSMVETIASGAAHISGRFEAGRTHSRAVLAALDQNRTADAATNRLAETWTIGMLLQLGALCASESDESFALADDAERRSNGSADLEIAVVRRIRHLFRGEQDIADELAESIEALLVQRPGGAAQAHWGTSRAAVAFAALGDSQGLDESISEVERIAKIFPSYAVTLDVLRAAQLRLRGELDAARDAYERIIAAHRLFTRVTVVLEALPGLMQVLCEQGRHAEAVAYARAFETSDGVPALERPWLLRTLLPNLCICEARIGEAHAAARKLDAAIQSAGNAPLLRWQLHGARAAVACEQRDPVTTEQHLKLAGKHARAAGSTVLVARHETLLEQLVRRRVALLARTHN